MGLGGWGRGRGWMEEAREGEWVDLEMFISERQNPVKVGVCFSIVFAPRTRSSFHHLFHVLYDSLPHAAIVNACDRVVWGMERV